jgi:hypothetical protein
MLSGGTINVANAITIELIQPDSMPAVVRIVWPTAATITTPARYLEVAAAMKVLAEASTTLARIKASRRRADPLMTTSMESATCRGGTNGLPPNVCYACGQCRRRHPRTSESWGSTRHQPRRHPDVFIPPRPRSIRSTANVAALSCRIRKVRRTRSRSPMGRAARRVPDSRPGRGDALAADLRC